LHDSYKQISNGYSLENGQVDILVANAALNYVLLPVWAAAILRLCVDNVFKPGDIENMGIAVRMLLLRALELEIGREPQMTTDGLHTSGFLRCHIRFLVGGVPPMRTAFCSPSTFRKSHESASLDLWG